MVIQRNPVLAMRNRLEKVIKRQVFRRPEPPVPERIALFEGADVPDEPEDTIFWSAEGEARRSG